MFIDRDPKRMRHSVKSAMLGEHHLEQYPSERFNSKALSPDFAQTNMTLLKECGT